ncbi:MAG: hypothetical protein ACRD2R_08475 [Terriglobales bacterium]
MRKLYGLAAVALVICLLFLGSCRKSPRGLSLLVWEGYADPSFVHAFEEK